MTYTKYTAGVMAYGYILQLTDSCAVVSLPGGVTGTIAHAEVSDVCYSLVQNALRGGAEVSDAHNRLDNSEIMP